METIKPLFFSVIKFIKKHRFISAAVLILLVLLFTIFKPKGPIPVPTENIKKGNIVESISVTGSVNSENSVDLTFQIPGTLTYIAGKTGAYVNKYQTIAAIDQRSAQKNLEQALIDYSKQRITFDTTVENNQNRTPQQALNDTMKRLLQDNQYDLDKTVNSVELQDLVKQKSFISTPISGIITREDADITGINITIADKFTITDPNSLIFEMDVDEADIGKVKEGQKIKANLNEYPNETLNLTVDKIDFVSHTTSTGGNAFTVKAKIPIPADYSDYKYRIGINGNAEIITNEKKDVLSVPLSSITNDNSVFIKRGSKFEKRKVNMGIQGDTRVEILNGVSEGDIVATDITSIPENKKPSIRFF